MARKSKPHSAGGYWRTRIGGKTFYLGRDDGTPASKRQAEARFHQIMAEKLTATKPGQRPLTIAGAISHFFTLHPAATKRKALRPFLNWGGDIGLADVDADTLHLYLAHLRAIRFRRKDRKGEPHGPEQAYNPETLQDYVHRASAVLAMAAKRGWCVQPEPPAIEKPEWKDRSVPADQLWPLLDSLPEHAAPLAKFLALTGARPGEAVRLEWGMVNFAVRACILPRHKIAGRTGKPRLIPLNDEAIALLRDLNPCAGLIFRNSAGNPYTVPGFGAILRRRGITPYQLRHSFAQVALNQGASPSDVSALMGHKKSGTVWRYAEIRDERMIAAASKLRLRPAVGEKV